MKAGHFLYSSSKMRVTLERISSQKIKYYAFQYLLDFQSSAKNRTKTFSCHHRGHCTEKLLETNIKRSYLAVLSVMQF